MEKTTGLKHVFNRWFFGLVSYNYKSGGGPENPTFLYDSGFRQVAINSSLEAQVQYNFDVPSFLDTNFTVGLDHRDVMSDSQKPCMVVMS